MSVLAPSQVTKRPRVFPAGARGTALFFGSLSLCNSIGMLVYGGFDATLWWLDLRILPNTALSVFVALLGIALCWWSVSPPARGLRGTLTDVLVLGGVCAAAGNCVSYYAGAAAGAFVPGVPIPLSLVVAAALAWVFVARPRTANENRIDWKAAVAAGVWMLLFPLLQMALFGYTNYSRPADAAVVFGAAVYRGGLMSHALFDRTSTGVALYQKGLVRYLVFSGGPGPGKLHETEAMLLYATSHGVPAKRILLDRDGLSTRDSVRNTVSLFREHDFRTVLAVSHFYHLPRIKLTYGRHAFSVYTVPAHERYVLHKLPWYMLREVAALWVYYLLP